MILNISWRSLASLLVCWGAVPALSLSDPLRPSTVGAEIRPSELSLGGWAIDETTASEESYGQPALSPESNPQRTNDWEFSLAPYLWMTSLRAQADEGPFSGTTDICFSELLKQLNVGGQLRIEGLRRPWGFYLDGTYLNLGGDATARVGPFRVRGLDVDAEITEAWLDFGGLYRFGEEGRSFDIMAGGRYSYIGTNISAGPLQLVDQSNDSVAPVFGGRLLYAISKKWMLSIAGDLGGFGVGNGADLSWSLSGIVGYQINESLTFGVGYRYFDIDLDDGDLDLDLQMHGPLIGMQFRF